MAVVCECCGKEVYIAAVFELEALSQFFDGGGKIPYCYIRLLYTMKEVLKTSLLEVARSFNNKLPCRNVLYMPFSDKEVAHRVKLLQVIALRKGILHASLHDACIGLEEVESCFNVWRCNLWGDALCLCLCG